MQVLKKIESGGFYLLKGVACANTLFFEDKEEKLKFQILANQYIGSLMEIREYCLTSDGWVLVVKLKSRTTIKRNFQKLKINSPSKGEGFVKVWEQVSEMVRMWLNHYSRWANNKRGREGSLVGKPYERYFFDSGEEAVQVIEDMRDSKIDVGQTKKRFRPMKKYYEIKGMRGLNSWIRTSKMVQSGRKVVQEIGLKCLYLWELSLSVASDLVQNTKNLHNCQKSSTAPT